MTMNPTNVQPTQPVPLQGVNYLHLVPYERVYNLQSRFLRRTLRDFAWLWIAVARATCYTCEMLRALALASLTVATCYGTIIVTVPTKGGVVIAADSRSTGPGSQACDSRQKVMTVPGHIPLAFAVSGAVTALKQGWDSPAYADLCDAMKRAPRSLDVQAEVASYLMQNGFRDRQSLEALTAYLVLYANRHRPDLSERPGDNLFGVTLVAHLGADAGYVVASCNFVNSNRGEATSKSLNWRQFTTASLSRITIEGDATFTNTFVVTDPSLAGHLRATPKLVGETPLDAGLQTANLIIETAYRQVREHPGSWNIGGPIQAFVVGIVDVKKLQ